MVWCEVVSLVWVWREDVKCGCGVSECGVVWCGCGVGEVVSVVWVWFDWQSREKGRRCKLWDEEREVERRAGRGRTRKTFGKEECVEASKIISKRTKLIETLKHGSVATLILLDVLEKVGRIFAS